MFISLINTVCCVTKSAKMSYSSQSTESEKDSSILLKREENWSWTAIAKAFNKKLDAICKFCMRFEEIEGLLEIVAICRTSITAHQGLLIKQTLQKNPRTSLRAMESILNAEKNISGTSFWEGCNKALSLRSTV